ncbi:MAG: DUF362 domain-containing protein [Chloroflexota bacterium]|nr:DUF362 domain-containing protein [Chloroflexota bacterium]
MASEVFFLNDRASTLQESIKFKAVKVFRDAGLGELFKPGDTVGIKIHFGEYGNSMSLRPQYVRSIVEEIQKLGGKPVVVDCTTICFNEYSSRATAKDMLWTAARHGLTEETLTCPVWVCDGDYGFDDVKVDVPQGTYLKHTYMGKKLLDLDAMIVLTHFKGHPMGVFGGALKNVGIGCGSKRGKLCTHLLNHPDYGRLAWTTNPAAVEAMTQGPSPTMMDRLLKNCPFHAPSLKDGVFETDVEKCQQCASCFGPGLFSGLLMPPVEIFLLWAMTIPDAFSGYVHAIGKDKVGYVTYAMDISPWCDCVTFSDRALVPNVGVLASKDPVAIDMACLEMTEARAGMPGSSADDFGFSEPGTERFTNCASMAKVSQWVQINSGIHNGLGTSEYELVISQPAEEYDFWMKPYTPDKPWGFVNREALSKGDWKPEYPFTYEITQLSMAEASLKPKGKAGEKEL